MKDSYFRILWWFFYTSTCIGHRHTCLSILTPSPLRPHTIPLDCPGASTTTVFLSTQLRQPLVGALSFPSLEVGKNEGREASCRSWCHSCWNKKVVVVKKRMWELKYGWFSRSFYPMSNLINTHSRQKFYVANVSSLIKREYGSQPPGWPLRIHASKSQDLVIFLKCYLV